jgi:hypothetical protein
MILKLLKRLFRQGGRFFIPKLQAELPKCEIRVLQDGDFEACEAIYHLNEPTHSPPGYFPRFSNWLRNRRALILARHKIIFPFAAHISRKANLRR